MNLQLETAEDYGILADWYNSDEGLFDPEWSRPVATIGCDKNFCLGTDDRWPKCPKCGSYWSNKEGCRVLDLDRRTMPLAYQPPHLAMLTRWILLFLDETFHGTEYRVIHDNKLCCPVNCENYLSRYACPTHNWWKGSRIVKVPTFHKLKDNLSQFVMYLCQAEDPRAERASTFGIKRSPLLTRMFVVICDKCRAAGGGCLNCNGLGWKATYPVEVLNATRNRDRNK